MNRALGLAALTGLVWTAAHPPLGVWWFALLVVPGWMTALAALGDDTGARRSFLVGLVTGLVAFLPMLWWLAAPATPIAPVLLALVLAAYLGVASVVAAPWLRSRWAPLVVPVVFAGVEVTRARWPLSGFGWGDLATAQVDGSWMLTVARVLGADGLTLLTVLLGGCAWGAVRRGRAVWREADVADDSAMSPGAARVVRAMDAARPWALGAIGVAVLGTLVTIGPPARVGEVDVLVVQGSDGVARASGAEEDLRILENHVEATRSAVADAGAPDLTVWAENAVDGDPDSRAALAGPLAEAGALTRGRLLAGLTADGPRPGTFRNQVVRVREDGSLGSAYDKIEVVPFGEYVPWRSLLGGLGPLERVPRDAIPGTRPVTHEVEGVRIATVICFETLFPGIVREAVGAEDAGLLVAATNDSSFGRTAEPAQHLAQSRLRAVETGRAVVHASISGVSALVTPDGAVVDRAPLFEVATVRGTLPVVTGATPAAVVGPVVSGLLGAAFLLLLLLRIVALVRRTP